VNVNDRYSDDYESAAGGLNFDGDIRERVSDLGSRLASEGPGALLEQIEELVPDSWKEHIAQFPISAVVLGVGVGVFLGLKKGNEILTTGSSLIAAAAAANINSVLSGARGSDSE
jgi:hypothetical protein